MQAHTCELHVMLPAGLLGESITHCCCVPYSITDHFFLALRETNQFTKIRTKQENHTTQLIPLPFSERLPSTSEMGRRLRNTVSACRLAWRATHGTSPRGARGRKREQTSGCRISCSLLALWVCTGTDSCSQAQYLQNK